MYKFEVYKDKKGEYRWRLKVQSGEIIADSGEGYKQKDDCVDGLKSVQQHAAGATIVYL